MAKITRKLMKIFGSSAGTDQIAKFGSLAAGVPAFTTDPETIQSLSNYLDGWFSGVIGENSPTIQDMNALFYLFAYQLSYIMQSGVPEWNSATTYYIGSFVSDGAGGLYASLTNTNLNNAVTDTANWAPIVSALNEHNVVIGNSNNDQQAANTNLLGRILATVGNFAVTISNATPGVFTRTAHGLSTYDTIYLTTTGALPTGLTASTLYYVTVINANTFKVSATLANLIAGTYVSTSSAGSGVHTAYFGGFAPKAGSIADVDVNSAAAISGSKIVAATTATSGVLTAGTQIIPGEKDFDTGIRLPATGGGAGTPSLLDYYESNASCGNAVFTMNADGPGGSGNTSVGATIFATRLGSVVWLLIPGITATANGSDNLFTWGGSIPARFRPSTSAVVLPVPILKGTGVASSCGSLVITSTGTLIILAGVYTGSVGAYTGIVNWLSGTAGMPQTTVVSYVVT